MGFGALHCCQTCHVCRGGGKDSLIKIIIKVLNHKGWQTKICHQAFVWYGYDLDYCPDWWAQSLNLTTENISRYLDAWERQAFTVPDSMRSEYGLSWDLKLRKKQRHIYKLQWIIRQNNLWSGKLWSVNRILKFVKRQEIKMTIVVAAVSRHNFTNDLLCCLKLIIISDKKLKSWS